MSQNIFLTNLSKYNKNGTGQSAGNGNWTYRNGILCRDIRPASFYKNWNSGQDSGILWEEIVPNKTYVFDVWINTDDVISGGSNVLGGMCVHTKNDSEWGGVLYFVHVGGNLGFVHYRGTFVSDDVTRLVVYYYTSMPTYYRWDSYLCLAENEQVCKNGLVNISNLI